jgi:hypothetical protein
MKRKTMTPKQLYEYYSARKPNWNCSHDEFAYWYMNDFCNKLWDALPFGKLEEAEKEDDEFDAEYYSTLIEQAVQLSLDNGTDISWVFDLFDGKVTPVLRVWKLLWKDSDVVDIFDAPFVNTKLKEVA